GWCASGWPSRCSWWARQLWGRHARGPPTRSGQESAPDGLDRRVRPIGGAELLEGALEILLHGPDAPAEPGTDLPVRQALRDQPQHFLLDRAQGVVALVSTRRPRLAGAVGERSPPGRGVQHRLAGPHPPQAGQEL